MEPAENGVIICYTEKTKSPSKGTYDNYNYDYKKEVYDIDKNGEEDDDDGINKAFDRFKELWMSAYRAK